MMGPGVKFLFVLCWMSFLLSTGLILFIRGFLLKRTVLASRATCPNGINGDFGVLFGTSLEEKTSQCWLPKRFQKSVVIVVDGLRYDFAAYNESRKEPDVAFYENKLPVVHELLERKPEHSALFRFVADAPTTTLQRIKGLVTGSLPTFVDAGDNFASVELDEDNVVDQLVALGKRITFLGDDTWMGLFPGRFARAVPFPSFDVKDLHTVDEGILKHLVPEIEAGDWDVVIAHFLGVDHCGHRHGPNHVAMAQKLGQMDAMIRSVAESLNEDTVLFVLGDHGMTQSGDHGGDSPREVGAALFVYSPSKIWNKQRPRTSDVRQIDFAPTFSLLMGIPIPFGSLGAAVHELLLTEEQDGWTNGKPEVGHLQSSYFGALALYKNAKQVDSYLRAYGLVSRELLESDEDRLSKLDRMLEDVDLAWARMPPLPRGTAPSPSLARNLAGVTDDTYAYLHAARDVCTKVWAQFDGPSMVGGLSIFVLALLLVVVHVTLRLPTTPRTATLLFVLAAVGTGVLVNLYYPFTSSIEGLEILLLVAIVSVSVVVYVVAAVTSGGESVAGRQEMTRAATGSDDWVALAMALFPFGMSFSNSYVVLEDAAVTYFAVSLLCCKVLLRGKRESVGKKYKSEPLPRRRLGVIGLAALSAACIRVLALFRRCREEQWWCQDAGLVHRGLASGTEEFASYGNWHFYGSVGSLGALVYGARWLMRTAGNLNGFSPAVICTNYAPVLMAVSTSFYWALRPLSATPLAHAVQRYEVLVPNVVLVAALSSLATLYVRPLCICAVQREEEQIGPVLSSDRGEVFRLVYRYVKANWRKHLGPAANEDPRGEKMLVVYGLASVFTASLLAVLTVAILVFLLLTDGGFAPAFLLLAIAAACILQCLAKLKETDGGPTSATALSTPWSGILLWSLLSAVGFYATGHQQTFPTLHWDAAAVGTPGNFTSHLLPGAKVLLNTFSATWLCGLGLPLLMLWPITSRLIFAPRGHHPRATDDSKQGEFALHGNPDFFQALHHLACKYLVILSIKLLGCMLAAAVLRRHLMVWKIFAPRLVFEALAFLSAVPAVLGGFLLMMSVHSALDAWIERADRRQNAP